MKRIIVGLLAVMMVVSQMAPVFALSNGSNEPSNEHKVLTTDIDGVSAEIEGDFSSDAVLSIERSPADEDMLKAIKPNLEGKTLISDGVYQVQILENEEPFVVQSQNFKLKFEKDFNKNLDAFVFSLTSEEKEDKIVYTAEEVEAEAKESELSFKADSPATYYIGFTYDKKHYELKGETDISDILKDTGLKGQAEKIDVDSKLVSVNGNILTPLQSFKETPLTVVIGDGKFDILLSAVVEEKSTKDTEVNKEEEEKGALEEKSADNNKEETSKAEEKDEPKPEKKDETSGERDIVVPEVKESNNILLLRRNLMPGSLMKSAMPNGVEETEFPVTLDNLTIEKAQIKWLSNNAGFNMLEMVDGLYDMQWQLDVAFSGKGYIEAGDIEIVMPAYLWKTRDDKEPSYVTMGIAEDDGNAKGDFAWKRVGDTVVITNIKKISAGTKLMVQGTYRSKYDATIAKGIKEGARQMYDLHTVDPDAPYHGITDDLYAVINVNTQENNELLTGTTNTIKGSIDTSCYVTEAKKQPNGNVYVKNVPSNIPAEFLPANSEDYYYVEWYVDGDWDGSQPGIMTFTDEPEDKYDVILLGATDRRGNNTKAENGVLGEFSQHYVWTAYPKSAFPEENKVYTLKNNLTVNVRGVDDEILTQKSTTAQIEFQTPVTWKIEKVWDYNEGQYSSSLEFRKEKQPEDTPVWISNGNKRYHSDTLNDGNNWYTEWTDDGVVRDYSAFEYSDDITRSTHPDGSSSSYWIVSGTIGDRVYFPNGSSYQKYWWYDHHKTEYDEENHKWTFYNDYHEGTIWSSGFTSYIDKDAINHTNNRVRATSDKDLVLLINDKETTDISYSVYRRLMTLEHTMKRDGDPYNPDDMKQNNVRMEAVDHTEYFAGRKLNPDEYYMHSVTLSAPNATDWVPNGSNNGRFTDRYNLPADLYGLVDDEWVKYAHLEGGVITCENGATPSGSKVTFNNQNVKKVKVETVTNGATLNIGYDVNIRLLPSEQIKNHIETLFSNSDYIMETSKNDVTFTLYNDETNEKLNTASDSDIAYLHGRNYRLAVDLDKTCTQLQNNVNERYLKTTNTITLNQVSNISIKSEFDYALEEDLLPDSASGTFYDLLPPGMQADLSTLKIKNGTIKTQNIIANYKNTGRQLVVITADIDHKAKSMSAGSSSNKYSDPTHPQYSGESVYGWNPAVITFDSIYTWEEARNRGFSDLRNTAAYIADEDEFGNAKYWIGDEDTPDGKNHTESLEAVIPALRDLMTDLKSGEDKPNTVYAGANVGVGLYDFMALTNLVKHVAITGSDNWSYGEDLDVNVAENGKYSYKIILTSGAQTTTKDIILLDALENYVPVKITEQGDSSIAAGSVISREEFDLTNENLEALGKTPMSGEPQRGWQGSFQGIDISEIAKMGVDAKVYYSTKSDISIVGYNPGNDPDKNTVPNILDNSGDWTDALPSDPSTVTAIAIDCRKDEDGNDFELEEYQSLIAYVHMKAPNHDTAAWAFDEEEYINHLKNARAYNNVYMDITQVDELGRETHSYDHFDFTRVGIYSSRLTVTKEWDDFNDNDRIRPGSVVVKLYANGEPTNKEAELDESNDWSSTFEYLPIYDDNGDMIYYVAKEEPTIEGYTSTSVIRRDNTETTVKLINKHDKIKVDVPFEKVWESEEEDWEDKIPTNIVVNLYKDGRFTGQKQTVRVNADGEWKGKFTNLDKFDDGREIEYSVVEESVGNDWIMEQVSPTKIKNIYYPYGDLAVSKTVVNGTEAALGKSFTFTFSLENADGTTNTGMYDYVIKKGNETVKEANISHGEAFTLKDGEIITIKDIPTACTYTVTEESKSGFTLTSKTNDSGHVNANEAVVAEFTNTYSSVGKAEISGTKTLEGRALTRSQFQFQLCNEEGNVIRTASNKADGTFTFGDINFTHEDDGETFTYIVKEVDRGRAGYTYDDRQYKVILTPVDNGDGTMTVGVDMKNIPEDEEDVSSLSFANEYHASGEIVLKAWKELKGRKLQNEEFEFELLDQNGKVLDTKKNALDGSITFDALEFTEKDAGNTYYYVVREKAGSDETVNYDENNYGYSVSVIDNGNGTLSFSQNPVDMTNFYKGCETCQGTGTLNDDPCDECNGSGLVKNPDWQSSEGELPVFKNTLKPGNLSVSKKTQNGGDPEQEFNFKIKLIGDEVQDKQFDFEKSKLPYNAYLTYDANGGEFGDGETQNKFTYFVNGDNVSVTDGTYEEPTRAGYDFVGWFEDAENTMPFTGDPEELSLTEDKTVYAKWGILHDYGVLNDEGELLLFQSYEDYDYDSYIGYGRDYREKGTFYDTRGNEYTGYLYVLNEIDNTTWYYYMSGAANNYYKNERDMIKSVDIVDGYHISVTYMMFRDLRNLESVNLDGLDTFNITNMSDMFRGCTNLTTLDISNFDTSNVTDMSDMFRGCTNLTTLDISNFDTSNVTDMSYMFSRCSSLSTLDISNFDTSNVTNMSYMFYGCSGLSTLDISNFDTSNVTNMSCMFDGCSNLNNIYVDESNNRWNTSNVTSSDNMFYNCAKLRNYNSYIIDKTKANTGSSGYLTQKDYVTPTATTNSRSPMSTKAKSISRLNQEVEASKLDEETDKNTIGQTLLSRLKSFGFKNSSRSSDGIVFENGEAEFTLKANNKLTFKDIPAGTAYQVYEETPDGWVLVEQRNASGEIVPLETSEVEFTNRYQPDVTTAQFSGTKTLDNIPAAKDSFEFELLENGEVLETVKVLDGGFIQFPVITYEEAGTHTYTIREVDPNNDTFDWDTHEETVTVTVTDNGDGTLSSTVNYDSDGIKFENKTRPGSLKIKKNATGITNANKDDEFTFKITLNNDKGLPLSSDENIYWYKEDATGNVVKSLNPLNRLNAFLSGGDTKVAKVNSSEINGKAPNSLEEKEEEITEKSEIEIVQKNVDLDKVQPIEKSKTIKNVPKLLNAADSEKDLNDTTGWISSWQHYGDNTSTIEWAIDDEGTLWMRPEHNQETGVFPSYDSGTSRDNESRKSPTYIVNPWYDFREEIVQFKAHGKIDLPYLDDASYKYAFDYFFADCINLISIDFSNFIVFTGRDCTSSRMLKNLGYIEYIDLSPLTSYYNTKFYDAAFTDFSTLDESAIGYHIEGGREVYHNLKTIVGVMYDSRASKSEFSSILNKIRYTTQTQSENSYLTNNVWLCGNNSYVVTSDFFPGWDTGKATLTRATHKINFDGNGGQAVVSEYLLPDILVGRSIKSPVSISFPSAYRSGYKFLGWTKEIDGRYGYLPRDYNFSIMQKNDSIVPIYRGNDYMYIYDFNSKTDRKIGSGSGEVAYINAINPIDLIARDTTLYAKWEYDGKNQINVNHYQETVEGGDYTLAETEVVRDTPGTEVTPQLKDYAGFRAVSSIETVTVDDEELVTVNYYYDRNRYNIKFDGNGATSGVMFQRINAVGGISTGLPKNVFSKKGAIFTGWNTKSDGTGTSFTDEQSVLNIGGDGDTVTLYAQWLENSNELTPSNGVIYVTCKAGETVVIPDLPDGTTYTVEEVNVPRGWEYVSGQNETGSIVSNGVSNSQVNNKYTADGLVYLEAHKKLEGDMISSGQFTFELLNSSGTVLQTKTNGDIDLNDQTSGTNGNAVTNKWKGTAPVSFDAINYTEADIGKTYTYRIREVNTGDSKIDYDIHTETVTVRVVDGGNGNVIATATYDSTGPLFTNKVKTGMLRLTKDILNSTNASEGKDFEFEIHLKDAAGNPLEGDYPYRKEHFDYGTTITGVNATAYSHMDNVDDTGKKLSNYANSKSFNDVVTIPGAHALHVKLVYGGESVKYDWVCMWQGNHPEYTAYNNYGSSITGKLGGGSYTSASNTKEYEVEGDTVTFAFRSDSSGVGDGYGYYAVITSEEVEIETGVSHSDISHGDVVTLKGGEVIEISGLPDGATYEIVEKSAQGWTQTGSFGANGTITAGEQVNAEFENTYSTTGSFTPDISKTFVGGDLSERSFDFEMTDENGNVLSRGKTDPSGKVTFAPIDYDQNDVGEVYYYYVNEVKGDDDSLSWDEHNCEIKVEVTDDGQGTITPVVTYTDTLDKEFTNTMLHNLKVSKEVSGAMSDKDKSFNYTVKFWQNLVSYDLEVLPEGVTKVSDGIYTFSLKDGEEVMFNKLPYGVKYKIEEEDTHYEESVDGTAGRIVDKVLTEDTSHSFQNNLDGVSPTGVNVTRNLLWVFMLACMALIILWRLKKKVLS